MYVYDQYDQKIVDERVAQYRDQTDRFLAGKLTEAEFLPLRLQNGLYVQRLAPMLRIAVPYGLMSSTQLRKLAEISRVYDKGYAHISTRQNVQLNWPNWRKCQTSWQNLPQCRCTRYRPAATVSAIPPQISLPVWLRMSWKTRVPTAKSFASGQPYTRSSPFFRANSRSRSAAAPRTGPLSTPTISAWNWCPMTSGEIGFKVLVGGGLGRTPVIGHSDLSTGWRKNTC